MNTEDEVRVPRFSGWRAKALTAFVMLVIFSSLDFALAQICNGRFDGVLRSEHAIKFRIQHPIYHHDLQPLVRVIDSWGGHRYPLATNSLGFKDSQPANVPVKRSGAKRLLVIGDSFAEGIGVAFDETFAGRMRTPLASRGWEILNASVSSYAPAVYYAKIRHLIETVGLELDRVVVFIDVSDLYDEAFWYRLGSDGRVADSDPSNTGQRAVFDKGFAQTLRENSILIAFGFLVRDTVRYQIGRAKMKARPDEKPTDVALWIAKTTGVRETKWLFDQNEYEGWAKRGISEAKSHMHLLKALLDKHGIGLDVVIYPWPDSIVRKDHPSKQEAVWQDWGREAGVRVIDLFPLFLNSRSPVDTLSEYFIPYDVHWNERGHALVADVLLRELAN